MLDHVQFWNPDSPVPAPQARQMLAGEFRGKKVTWEKPDGVYRIVSLGGSSTFGWPYLDRPEVAYPAVLERLLNSRSHNPKVRYEVINAGIGGYSSYQGLAYFKERLWRLHPDMVTVCFGANDSHDNYDVGVDLTDREYYERQRKIASHPVVETIRSALNHLRVFALVGKGVLALKMKFFSPRQRVPPSEFERNMKELLSRQHALLPFPEKLTINTDICPEKCRDNAKGSVRWCRKERKTIENPSLECPKHCTECVDHCHREALAKDGETTKLKEETLCLRCAYCEVACPHGAMEVHPVYTGTIHLDDTKCPETCNLCIDACPVEAIHREETRVFIEDTYCILCGACAKICDRGAIEMRRDGVTAQGEAAAALWETCVENLKQVVTSEG